MFDFRPCPAVVSVCTIFASFANRKSSRRSGLLRRAPAVLAALLLSASAGAQTTFTGSGASFTIFSSSAGVSSSITVSGATGPVATVSVELDGVKSNGVAGNSLQFAEFLLVGPDGQQFVLLGSTGDSNDGCDIDPSCAGLQGTTPGNPHPDTIVIQDSAPNPAPNNAPWLTSSMPYTVRPSSNFGPNGWGSPPLPTSVTPGDYPQSDGTQTLNEKFAGSSANGTWALFIVDDDTPIDPVSISGWKLTLTYQASSPVATTTSVSSLNPASIVSPATTATVILTATVGGPGDPPTGTVAFSVNGSTIAGCGAVALSAGLANCNAKLAQGSYAITALYAGVSGKWESSSGSMTQLVEVTASNPSGDQWCNDSPFTDPANSAPGTVYPSVIKIPSAAYPGKTVANVQVELNNVSLAANGTAGPFLLVAPGGANNLDFLDDAFDYGTAASGVNLTFADTAGSYAPLNSELGGGPYLATDNTPAGYAETLPDSSAPSIDSSIPQVVSAGSINFAPTYGSENTHYAHSNILNFGEAFNGAPANGAWALYSLATQSLAVNGGWCITLTLNTGSATTTAVTSSQNPQTTGQPVTLTATVTSGGNPVTTGGTVTFADTAGATPVTLASGVAVNTTTGTASFITSTLTEGDHRITATYSGTAQDDPSFGSMWQRTDNATTVTQLSSSEWQFCNPGPVQMQSGAPAGPMTPNPSNIFVTNLPGAFASAGVQFTNFSDAAPGNLYQLASMLKGPNGSALDFFSNTTQSADGYSVANLGNYTFEDSASALVPVGTGGSSSSNYQLASGSYKPTAEVGIGGSSQPDAFTSSFSGLYNVPSFVYAAPRGTDTLAEVFPAGMSADGTWSLFFNETAAAQTTFGAAGGWCLNLTEAMPTVTVTAAPSSVIGEGQQGAELTVAIDNTGTTGPTGDPTGGSDPMTVTYALNSNFTYAGSYSGSGWTCSSSGQTVTCANDSAVAQGSSYPTLGIKIDVSPTAMGPRTSQLTVGGAGVATMGPTPETVNVGAPVILEVAKSHSGSFVQGSTATWNIVVTDFGPIPTSAPVTVSDTLPSGYTLAGYSGSNWTCSGSTTVLCTSDLVELSGMSFPTLQLRVSVPTNSPASVSNTALAWGGGDVLHTSQATAASGSDNDVSVIQTPTISSFFSPNSIGVGGIATLIFHITNANAMDLTGVAFTDTLPAGLAVASSPNLEDSCGGTFTAVAGSSSLSLQSALIGSGVTCTVWVNVTATSAGAINNVTGSVTSGNGGTGNAASASLTVLLTPTISNSFSPSTIGMNGTSLLTLTITNPNPGTALTGVAFADNLGAGTLINSSPSNSCGGTVTAVLNSSSVALSGGTVGAGSSCTVSVDVLGLGYGVDNTNLSNVTSTNAGSGIATGATLNVVYLPTISNSFSPSTIALNGTTSLQFTLRNQNPVAMTGVAFTDTLPAGLAVASSPNATSNCGGTLTATAGSGTVALSGGGVSGGGSCTISVNVTATTAGVMSNTTGAVSSSNDLTGSTSNTATLTVLAPPTIAEAFGASSIPVGSTTLLSFTITNPNAGTLLTGVGFTDGLPAGLTVATGGSVACGGGSLLTLAPNNINLTGASVGASGSCTVSVTVTGSVAAVANNTTSAVSSNNGGTGSTSNTATLTVLAPPTIGSSFGASTIVQGSSTSLTFTLTNPNAGSALAGVAFSDTLPTGLTVASLPNATSNCGGTLTATAGSGTVALSGGAVNPDGSCAVSVNVTGDSRGVMNNITSAVSSTNGGTGQASNMATLTVGQAPTFTSPNNTTFTVGTPGSFSATATAGSPGSVTLTISNLQGQIPGVSISGSGAGTITITGTPTVGGVCTFTITATNGGGLTATQDFTLTAVAPQVQLTTIANPAGGGTVIPVSGNLYNQGAVVNLSATANTGYSFLNWTSSPDPVASATSSSTTIQMNAAETVTANFTPTLVVNTPSDDAGNAGNCTAQATPGTNTTDAACSLRDALLFATNAGSGNITFDSTAFAASNTAAQNTITLSNGTLTISPHTTVTGPTTGSGATRTDLVTVDGGGSAGSSNGVQIFNVALWATGTEIDNLVVADGYATSFAAAIVNGGSLTVKNCTFQNNRSAAGTIGAAIYNANALTVIDSTFSGNAGQLAGGIYNDGVLSVSGSTFSANTASASIGGAGGIFNANAGTLTVTDSTFSTNTGPTAGGILNYALSTPVVTGSTFSGNIGTSGNALYNIGGAIALANDLSSDGIASQTGSGGFADDGGNAVLGLTAGLTSSSFNLASLFNYGGTTKTILPLPDSAGICAGTLTPSGGLTVPATDQRGFGFVSTYCPSNRIDAGAVQTAYALSFVPGLGATQVFGVSFAASVTLTESGNPVSGVTIPLTLNGGGTLLGGSAATNNSGIASYTLTATNPTTLSGLTLTATLPSPPSLTANSSGFELTPPQPAVTGVAPSSGPSAGGTSVTITGTNLGGATAVNFGAIAATNVTVVSSTQITATASAGTGTANITVTTAGGTSAISLADQFSYVAPVSTSLTPTVTPSATFVYNQQPSISFALTPSNATGIVATNFSATLDGSTLLAVSAGSATNLFSISLPATPLTVGPHTIAVNFTGTPFYLVSSASIPLTVTTAGFVVNTATDDATGTASNCPASAPNPATNGVYSCSLRDALAAASAAAGGAIAFDTTVFASGNTAAQNTVTLSYGTLNVPSSTSVTGPTTGSGAALTNLVNVSGNSLYRVFSVASPASGSTISNLTISHGLGDGGGAISIGNNSTLTVNDCTFTGNAASPGFEGGAIENFGALTVSGSTFVNNSAQVYGGAVYSTTYGTLVAANDTFTGNSANQGGAIYNAGAMTVSNSTFNGNSAGSGGGLFNAGTATTVTNSVFAGNAGGDCAGVGCSTSAKYILISGTEQPVGGGWDSGSITIAMNDSNGNHYSESASYGQFSTPASIASTFGPLFSNDLPNLSVQGFGSLIEFSIYNGASLESFTITNPSVSFTLTPVAENPVLAGNGNIATASANLSVLGSYGGPTQTMLPLPGSPAICAISPSTTTGTDQRGDPRTTQYGATACQDSGATQTNYSIAFAQQPTTVTQNATMALAPTVQLKESGVAFADGIDTIAIPLSLTTGSGTVGGGSVSTSATTGIASYSALSIGFPGIGDVLTANLALNSATPATALSVASNPFNVNSAVTQLAFIASPPTTVTAGDNAGTVTVGEDAAGPTLVTTASDTVTLTVTGPGSYSNTYMTAAIGGIATFSLSSVPLTAAGSYSYTAALAGNASVTPASTSETVSAATAASVTMVSGTPQSATIGSAFAAPLKVKAQDRYGNPVSSASVTFTAPANGASARFTASPTTTGADGTARVTATANGTASGTAYTVTASLGGTGTTASFLLTNTPAATTLTVTPAPAASVYGQSTTIAAAIAPASVLTSSPSGSVSFYDGATPLTPASTVATANASYTVSVPAVGSHTYAAQYGGDNNFAQSLLTSATAAVVVGKASSVLSGPSSPVNLTYGAGGSIPISLSGQYSGAGIAAPSGSLSYTIGGGTAQTAAIAAGTATLMIPSNQPAGNSTITVSYPGDSNYNPATSILVNLAIAKAAATVTLGSLNQTYTGLALLATAATTPANLTVNFTYNGSTTAPTTVGSYTVVGTINDANYQGAATGMLAISRAPSNTVVTSANPVLLQNATTLEATVTSGAGAPTGIVTFLDGTTPIGTGTLAGGLATLSVSNLSEGAHTIAAAYGGDANFLASTSSTMTQLVEDFSLNTGSSSSISSSSATTLPGGSAVFTFTISPVAGTTFPSAITLSLSGLPQGATYSFSPASIAAGAAATQITLTVNLPQANASANPASQHSGGELAANPGGSSAGHDGGIAARLAPFSLALLLIPFAGRMRRAGRRMGRTMSILLLLGAGLAAMAGIGCGSNSGFFAQDPQTYTVTVTATSGALSHSSTVTLTVE